MKNLSSKSLILILALACFLTGCVDPSEEEMVKGQNIDITRMKGKVVGKSIKYFKGDRDPSMKRKWQPYYCIVISFRDESGTESEEEFKDVSKEEVFDAVNLGTNLPVDPLLTLTQLTRMEGEIVDMDRNLDQNKFWIVVLDLEGIRKYGVDMKTYYTLVRVGTKLPLDSFMIKN